MKFNYKIAGDQSILVELGRGINEFTNHLVRSLNKLIETSNHRGIGEVILGYNTLLIEYNPVLISYEEMIKLLREFEEQVGVEEYVEQRVVEIPVLYGSEWGPDLIDVAETNNLTQSEVIEIHTQGSYLVYFLGFTPGYPFMGGMSEKLATPRLSSPRMKITAGSVGIANSQTGIYPVDSPGGWRLIGRTPLKLYEPKSINPFLLNSGDIVKFKSIDLKKYEEIKRGYDSNRYVKAKGFGR